MASLKKKKKKRITVAQKVKYVGAHVLRKVARDTEEKARLEIPEMDAPRVKKVMPTGGRFAKGETGNRKGRPKGATAKKYVITEDQRMKMAQRYGISPIDFMYSVLRDPRCPLGYQIQVARDLAPYVHRKMPIAIEGGDVSRPIRVARDAVQSMDKQDQEALLTLLVKTGILSDMQDDSKE